MGEEIVGVFAPASVHCSTMLIISAGGGLRCLCRQHEPYILKVHLSTVMVCVNSMYVSKSDL